MSTLVEWLRTAAKARSDIDAYLHGEAADEIERLRVELKAAHAGLSGLQETVERLRGENKWLCERMVELETKCSKLLAD